MSNKINNCVLITFFLLSTFLSVVLNAFEIKKISERVLHMDGELEDISWGEIKPHSSFSLFKERGKTVNDTKVKIAYDNKWLYFSLQCINMETGYDRNTAKKHDDPVSKNESVEIFISVDKNRKSYYHFMLNCDNVKAEQKVVGKGKEKQKKRHWNPTWLSAISRNNHGWNAEIAIPLDILAKNNKIGPLSFNICRTKIIPEFDKQGVRIGVKRQLSTLFPVKNSFHEQKSFAELKGLETVKLPKPSELNWKTEACKFKLEDGVVAEYYTKNGKTFYDVVVKILCNSKTYAWSYITVIDKTAKGKITEITKKQCFVSGRQKKIKLSIPVTAIEARTVTVVLKDYLTKGVVNQFKLATDKLTPLKAFFGRNYYTSEKYAELACSISLLPDSLNSLKIVIKNSKADELFRADKVSADNLFQIALEEVPLGTNKISVELVNQKGVNLFHQVLTLIKRHPNPGNEWKIDQLNRVLLNNGKPFFPLGVTVGKYTDARLRAIKDMGCNMFLKWVSLRQAGLSDEIFDVAAKYGLYVMDNLETYDLKNGKRRKIPNLGKYLSGEDFNKEAGQLYNTIKLQSTLNSSHPAYKKLTREQRNEIFNVFYQEGLPRIIKGIKAAVKHKNLMGYHIFDEPRFTGFDMFVQGQDLYKKVNQIDGYHPTLALYYPPIPPESEVTSFCDILCTDPYWIPDGTLDGRSTVNYVAKIVNSTEERANAAKKMTWIVLMGSYWGGTHKRVISPAEQICQSYLAIIHGARGLMYFVLPPYQPLRSAIKTISKHVKVLSPAILAPKVKQEIVYSPVEFKPGKGSFPDVQVALFQYPEGDAILLATNTSERQVKVSYALSCLPAKGEITRLFGQDKHIIVKGTFKDNIKPFDVRAYKIILKEKLNSMVKIVVKSEPDAQIPPPTRSKTISYYGRKGKKNIFPNPSFEEASLPGWPNYLRITDKTIVGDHIKVVKDDPYDGKVCLQLTNRIDDPSGKMLERVGFRVYCAPQNSKIENYTWSVYMKGSRDGLKVRFGCYEAKTWTGTQWETTFKTVRLSKKWKRYSITGPFPANASRRCSFIMLFGDYGKVWVDAVQMEKGDKPTDFEK